MYGKGRRAEDCTGSLPPPKGPSTMLPSIGRARLSLALAVSTSALLVAALPASAAIPAGNLITNPGAEAGTTGWTLTSTFEAVPYGFPGGFPDTSVSAAINGGDNFFAGGSDTALSTAAQVVDVSGAATEIDAGGVSANLSGYLGGFDGQDDNAVVSATFLDA